MYRIIGADGREYGPIPADVVRQWIREKRANADTRVLVEGAAEWVRLSTVAEFASDLGTPSGTSPGLGSLGAGDSTLSAAILERNPHFSVMSCLSRGWELVRNNFWLTVGVSALILVLLWASGFVPVIGPLLLAYVLLGGLDWMYLKLARGQPAELNDAFVGFGPLFVPLMLFSVVGQVLTTVGYLLCILPGIYLTVVWMLFPALLILDKGMDFWPAMELSRKVAQRHFWPLLGLFCLCFLLALAGLLALLVGFFIAWPIATASVVYSYEYLFGSVKPEKATPVPQVPGEGAT